ncbi:dihydrofolate reductase [Collinsella sp. zg1085]|uniref:dihydrofolate reductase n=1 Tax=Collinsella sp. zg1085 TaxID=2844380 RepID=UPI001C0DAB79|nr:dihydrofolate reductase [Collinsella sp. zg1085]QWT17115.1 dihydrofolate reductase [Collinsella sp. zg1085]
MAVLKAIVAVCDDWGIGCSGDMVVNNKADMRHFVDATRGATLVMGRKTLESLPGAKPLPGRRNIVITRDSQFAPAEVEVIHSIDELDELLGVDELAWVIGGGQIYQALLGRCSEAIITKNHVVHPVDTRFPNLDEHPDWRLVSESDTHTIQAGEGDAGVKYQFCTYQRV